MSGDNKIQLANIQLISLHVPKTAGTSFYNILKNQYGRRGVVRVDFRHDGVIFVNKKPKLNKHTLQRAKVIHGHFNIPQLKDTFDIPDDTPIITWIRDPVKRVISHYFYLLGILEGYVPHKKVPGLLKVLRRTLIEYARLPNTQNLHSHFMTGTDINDYAFIGLVEHFEEDLKELTNVLDWNPNRVRAVYENKTPREKPQQTEEQLETLRALNEKDVQLYDAVKKTRGL